MHTTATLERAAKRFRSFRRDADAARPSALAGELLDLGCGRGEFVLTALQSGIHAAGLDVNMAGITAYKASAKPEWADHCLAYDGTIFPFEAARFSAIHSWFVFEHLAHPHETIAELSRVAADDCVLVLNAQDGRTLVEAHAQIPWLPFMPKPLQRAWLDEITSAERRDYICDCVFPTTADEVAATLQFFGWRIVRMALRGAQKPCLVHYPCDEQRARATAAEALKLFQSGAWPQEPLNYTIVALRQHGPGVPATKPQGAAALTGWLRSLRSLGKTRAANYAE
jgi:SAM-dependent methyltransferase